MKYVWDLNRNRPLWITNGIAEDGVTGRLFAVDEVLPVTRSTHNSHENFIPIMKSSYHTIVDALLNWYGSYMSELKWIEEINVELRKYGL